jgi:hypothetical protein
MPANLSSIDRMIFDGRRSYPSTISQISYIQLLRSNVPVILFDSQSVVIGGTRCIYNARSPFLRCSVNPKGPCESCRDFLLQETIYEN